jgi:hypothetical protein
MNARYVSIHRSLKMLIQKYNQHSCVHYVVLVTGLIFTGIYRVSQLRLSSLISHSHKTCFVTFDQPLFIKA